jgi:hypothetical protein
MRWAELPDSRLKRRITQFLALKAAYPEDGITRGSRDAAMAKGIYRVLENKRVTSELISNAVHMEGAKSMSDRNLVLVLQDTMTLMLSTLEATTGLGTVDKAKEEALLMHTAMAVTPNGLPLGLLHSHVWARPLAEFGKGSERKKRPVEEKESYLWAGAMFDAIDLRDRFAPDTQMIHVFDRAGDVYEVLREIVSHDEDCVIRCCQNRRVQGEHGTIRDTLEAAPVLKRYTIDIPRKHGQRARRARVELHSARVKICSPAAEKRRETLAFNVVWVNEPAPPVGPDPEKPIEPVEWMLITTLPIDSVAQCLLIVKYYKLRWRIEEYHLALKSGCNIEKTQLKTAGRIKTLLAICCPVAMRMVQLTYLARTDPDAPCTETLEEDEWRLLWAFANKRPPAEADSPPTNREAILIIARIGGHLGRKCDGMPGVRVVWKGIRDLGLMLDGYLLSK